MFGSLCSARDSQKSSYPSIILNEKTQILAGMGACLPGFIEVVNFLFSERQNICIHFLFTFLIVNAVILSL